MVEIIAAVASVVLAFAAACLWFYACFVRVTYKPVINPDGWVAAAITYTDKGRQFDPFKTADAANRWNAAAAALTGLASLCQGASMIAHVFGH